MALKRCPVNALPTELLAHIFYLGTHQLFPVKVSHVCRLWRRIALGSPSLWTTIIFPRHWMYELSKIWIERSKSLPLEIKIDVFQISFEPPVPPSRISTIFDIIVPHVTRWQKLNIDVDRDEDLDHVLTRLAQCSSAPLLKTLALHHSSIQRFRPTSSLVPFHGNTPRLSSVALEDVVIGWSSSLLHDLVEFELDYQETDMLPSWVDFSRILRESPRLTTLKLRMTGPLKPITDWPDEPIELPSLEYLELTNIYPINVSTLFTLLSLPNLKALFLDLFIRDYSGCMRQLATPPQSILPRLQYLKIHRLSCNLGSIKAMYEQLTDLKSIYLNCKSIDKSFFTTLGEPCSGTLYYCPNLTTIVISGIDGQDLRSLIAMRAMARIPIKRIVMSEGDALDGEDERWLRENVQSFDHCYLDERN